MTQREIIRKHLNKSDWEITKDKCDSTRAHRRHLAANGKHETERKIYCTNVHLRIIGILITSVYNSVLSLPPLHFFGKLVKNPPVRGQHGEACIELKEGAKPKKQRPYENHGKKHEILRDIIQRNLREFGWLEACMTSEWCCAPFTVPKPPPADQNSIDGWRMVVDFCNLNAETKADSHPLPLIEEEIVKRAKGKLFSVLDLRHGFHQMPLAKSSRPLTCICSPVGPVQWTVMPMGLKNAPSFFQRMMEEVFFSEHPELREFVSVYIDDIIIATVGNGLTEQELVDLHEKQLNMVLDILDKNQLICGPKKGKLLLESVEFCGSLLRNETRQRSPGKLLAIQKWKRPETISALRGFPWLLQFLP